jgi:hypothetical protein
MVARERVEREVAERTCAWMEVQALCGRGDGVGHDTRHRGRVSARTA